MSAYQPQAQPVDVSYRSLDPTVNPEVANDMVRELTEGITSGGTPLMMEPPSNEFPLPGGYLDSDGVLHKTARVKEINGSDEEMFAREMRNPKMPIVRVVDLILRRTVTAIGTIEPVTAQDLGKMLIGDRASLFLAARVLTFGKEWEVPDWPCRLCGQTFGISMEVDDDIPVKELPDPRNQEIEVKLRAGQVATAGLMTGVVQLAMVGDGDKTVPEEQTYAIDQCLRAIDGKQVRFPMAQQMGMADRRKIIEEMEKAQPGPQMEEVVVTCLKCGGTAKYSVGLLDLFR
jgi:hypothetical protein